MIAGYGNSGTRAMFSRRSSRKPKRRASFIQTVATTMGSSGIWRPPTRRDLAGMKRCRSQFSSMARWCKTRRPLNPSWRKQGPKTNTGVPTLGTDMDKQAHWEGVYHSKAAPEMSWFRRHLDTSLALIERVASDRSASIVDVGGGESTLVDDLIARGYQNITVMDIAENAIEHSKTRLGPASDSVSWLVADITKAQFPPGSFDVWHDRAVFHFLTEPVHRRAYVQRVTSAVKPGGHVIVATFGPEGPQKCSGLEVIRYDSDSLHGEFGARFV